MSAATTVPDNAMSFETKARPWWMMLIEGIALTFIGGLLLFGSTATRLQTWETLIILLGVWWVIRGIMDLVAMFIDHTAWGWKLFMGIISIIAGGFILMQPLAAAAVIPSVFVLVLGIWGLVQGIVMLMLAFRGGGWGAGILGALAILFGLILIGSYGQIGIGISFVLVAAIFAFVGGIVMIVQSIRTRSA